MGLSESDSKLYATFDFYDKKNHKHLKNTLIYKAKQFMLTKTIWVPNTTIEGTLK